MFQSSSSSSSSSSLFLVTFELSKKKKKRDAETLRDEREAETLWFRWDRWEIIEKVRKNIILIKQCV